jgi:hypothetical protein
MQRARNEYGLWMERPRNFYEALPHYRLRVSRWPWHAMQDLLPWTKSERYSLRLHAAPNNQNFDDGESDEYQASLLPGSFLQALSGNSTQSAGFRFQLINAATDETLFESDLAHISAAGSAVAPFNMPSPFLLPGGGLAFPHGGQIIVRMTNMANAAARCQLILWIAEPLGGLI